MMGHFYCLVQTHFAFFAPKTIGGTPRKESVKLTPGLLWQDLSGHLSPHNEIDEEEEEEKDDDDGDGNDYDDNNDDTNWKTWRRHVCTTGLLFVNIFWASLLSPLKKQKSQIFYLKVSHLVKFQLLKNEQVAN